MPMLQHCRYYIRPATMLMIDGPVSQICTIDRQKNIYPISDQESPGDRRVQPDDYCGRFEIDPPPKL